APHRPSEHRAADEHHRHGSADTYRAQPEIAQMQRDDDAEEAVTERSDRLRDEDRGEVSIHAGNRTSPVFRVISLLTIARQMTTICARRWNNERGRAGSGRRDR